MIQVTRFSVTRPSFAPLTKMYQGKVKGASGRTKSIPDGYDGKFPNNNWQPSVAAEKVED